MEKEWSIQDGRLHYMMYNKLIELSKLDLVVYDPPTGFQLQQICANFQ